MAEITADGQMRRPPLRLSQEHRRDIPCFLRVRLKFRGQAPSILHIIPSPPSPQVPQGAFMTVLPGLVRRAALEAERRLRAGVDLLAAIVGDPERTAELERLVAYDARIRRLEE